MNLLNADLRFELSRLDFETRKNKALQAAGVDPESFKRFPEITQMFQNLRLLFLRFFIAVREIKAFLFYGFLWHKTKKNVSHLVIPLITQQTQLFSSEFEEFLIFVDICENIVMTFVDTPGESLYARGGTR